MHPLVLPEYQTARVSRGQLSDEAGMRLYNQYHKQVQVKPPGLADDTWRLTNRGWVGYIPLERDSGIFLEPKIPLANLFGMMEYAYRLGEFLDSGLYQSASVGEFYEQLAYILARRVLARGRQSFYRAYVPKNDTLPYIRGRINLHTSTLILPPTSIDCHFHEYTLDIEDNQILCWTLQTLARSGLLSPRVAPAVRQAYRSLAQFVTLQPFNAKDLTGRVYHRLNQDYRGLHALCRFFLDNSGPQHQTGEQLTIPFLVDMARLFELFVAKWLQVHLPGDYLLRSQERVEIGDSGNLHVRVDLVLYDRAASRSLAVLDTKYKTPNHAAPEDVFQVAGYADLKKCNNAYLVYPAPLKEPLDAQVGDVRVRSLVFGLEGDLNRRGGHFIAPLLEEFALH
jgi:5-methylcytosine-specific restriction enzyme subunit McrC